MARDRKAEAARRNERAQAEGFSSYGQKYRGERANYTKGRGAEYNAALQSQRAGKVVKVNTGGKVVISGGASDMAAIMRAVRSESQRRKRRR